MPRQTLTGSRIRERRIMRTLRQAELARLVGISPSYLNLIEHNRRRIGGKLLVDIAGVLGVEPSLLSEGAEATLIATLREAAADAGTPIAETERADELAGRFPGWAEVLAVAHRRIATLERTVETLSDRLAHDPQLATSLHEVLSTAAAIHSTAAILAEPGEIEPEWRDRFHRNLNEDSQRLADSSRALVTYLDDTDLSEDRLGAPQEEVEAFFAQHGHHFPILEQGGAVKDVIRGATALRSGAARQITQDILDLYVRDAQQIPLAPLRKAVAAKGIDPIALAEEFAAPLETVFRRLAVLPPDDLPGGAGLVVCDASGSILFRKPLAGFSLPRFGASCPLWPVFLAFGRPMVPLHRRVTQQGRRAAQFDCYAIAHPLRMPDFDHDPLFRSTMLILPAGETADEQALPVGSSCRICPRERCPARREPSVLREEF